MAFRWRADDGPTLKAGLAALWFFRGSAPVLLRNPIFLWFFRGNGEGGPDPCLPSGSAHGYGELDPSFQNCWIPHWNTATLPLGENNYRCISPWHIHLHNSKRLQQMTFPDYFFLCSMRKVVSFFWVIIFSALFMCNICIVP